MWWVTAHSRPVFNPRTRRRRPIRLLTVRTIVTDVSCSPRRRMSQMAPSVMAPTRSGSGLRVLIASSPIEEKRSRGPIPR